MVTANPREQDKVTKVRSEDTVKKGQCYSRRTEDRRTQ